MEDPKAEPPTEGKRQNCWRRGTVPNAKPVQRRAGGPNPSPNRSVVCVVNKGKAHSNQLAKNLENRNHLGHRRFTGCSA